MTTPVGAVELTVDLDGSEISPELTTAVQDAMRSMNRSVQRGMRQFNQELNRVDTSGINDLTDDLDQVSSGSSTAARRIGQLEDALDDARQETRRLSDQMEELTRESRQAGDEGESSVSGIGDAAQGAVNQVAGLTAGLVAAGGAAEAIGTAIEQADIGNRLAAQLDLTEEESEEAGRIAGRLYTNAFGEDFEQVNETIRGVASSLRGLGTDGAGEIESLSEAALNFNAAFGVETSESIQTVSQLIRNDLAANGTEGFDLLTAATQRANAAMGEEIPELINEYGTFFSSLGFDGQEAFSILVNASDQGTQAMDAVGDSLKEATLAVTELDNADAAEALESIGLAGQDVGQRLLEGGDTAREAFQQMVGALLEVEDPSQQAADALALFGDPLGNLNTSQIPAFLEALSGAGESMEGFEGSAESMGETLNSGPGVALEEFQRTVQQAVIDTLGSTVQYFQENEEVAIALGVAIGALTTAYIGLRTAAAVGAVIQGVSAAMAGATLAANSAALATGAYTTALAAQRAAALASAAATNVAAVAMRGFGAALAFVQANPIVLAITAIVGALTFFFTQTETGRELFEQIKDVAVEAWDTISSAIASAWEFIQPIFQSIWSFITETLAPVFANLVADIQEAVDAWSGLFQGLWNNVVRPIFGFIVDIIRNQVAPAITFLWENVVRPAFDGIGQIITFWWENVVQRVFNAWRSILLDVIVPAVLYLWQNVIQPAFEGIGNIISGIWENAISPAFDAIQEGVEAVGGTFDTVVAGIETVWNTLRGILAEPINFMIGTVYNDGIRKAWNSLEPFIPGLDEIPPLSEIPTRATGGSIFGPGSGTSDDILAFLSNGEHVVTAAEVARAGGQDVIYAIRDMIARGIPFRWDNGSLISELGRNNLQNYGAAVRSQGIGNVDPQGLFDPLATVPLPQFFRGGRVEDEPWMQQLMRAHEFAKRQNGKPYEWGGPTGPGSGFDCSGFMASIAAVIQGRNPWTRYWATSDFAGYPATGPQGFMKGTGPGFTIGVTDDPGGPGGGHTSGVLGAVAQYIAARVEAGGALGNVHYGSGTDPRAFDAQYHLPIGANGFFDPGDGSTPSPDSQRNFLKDRVRDAFNVVLDPVKNGIASAIGSPPPEFLDIPPKFLDRGRDLLIDSAFGLVDSAGDLLGAAWSRAQDTAGDVLDALNPFDNGGLISGPGVFASQTREPERVLSPEQTRLFEQLVAALTDISTAGIGAAGRAAQNVVVDISDTSIGALQSALGVRTEEELAAVLGPEFVELERQFNAATTETGQLISDTTAILQRTSTSQAEAAQIQFEQQANLLFDIANRLSSNVLGPIFSSALDAGISLLQDGLDAIAGDIVDGTDRTTRAVENLDGTVQSQDTGDEGPAPPFGAPGSAFNAASALSDAVVSVADAASQAFQQVARDITNAALEQTRSEVGESRGLLGQDISGGFLVDLIVRLTGVEIEIRDLLEDTHDEILSFREDSFTGFDENGRLISDTAALIQRNQSSIELAAEEQERIQEALIKSVIKYLITSILIPIITAILGAMITLATTAIGAAIGSAIPVIGTAIGAAVGAAVGAALTGLASIFTSLLAVGAGAALEAFDEGGIAQGTGFLPKNTVEPERVLSPEQTKSFDRLVDVLENGGLGDRNVSIANMNVSGRDPAQRTADNLLYLINS